MKLPLLVMLMMVVGGLVWADSGKACNFITQTVCTGGYYFTGERGKPAGDFPEGAPVVECRGEEYDEKVWACICENVDEETNTCL